MLFVMFEKEKQMDNKISFQGAFLLSKPGVRAQKELSAILTDSKKIVFDNFKKNGDILYILTGKEDAKVAKYVHDNELDFTYMPDLKHHSQLFPNRIDIKNYIKIRTKKGLQRLFPSVFDDKTKKLSKNDKSYIDVILKKFGFDKENYSVRSKHGVKIVVDNRRNRTVAKFSPKSRAGLNYVYIKPEIPDNGPFMVSLDGGEIKTEYKSVKQFKERFIDAVKFSLNK